MINKEHDFYNEIKNWDFSYINYIKENFTRWDMYEILKNNSNSESRVLDLGTGGGEKVLKYFPEVKEIIATDFSEMKDNEQLTEEIDLNKLDEYIKRNSSEKGILLIRRYYGITARK